MATFEEAIPTVLKHEGRFVNHKSDPGGATNFGVSLRYLKTLGDLNEDGFLDGDFDRDSDVDIDDIKKMSVEDACAIYKKNWWDRYEYERFLDQAIATKLFDMSVNMGHKQAVKLLQRACKRAAPQCFVMDDGVLGPITINTTNKIKAQKLLSTLKSECAEFYQKLIIKNPKFAAFEKGWMKRAYS